ncbi:MAG: molybdopterin converting factor subunit 1 [Acidobacteria bacterium]|nr:molybdopterin converting factor subunit 1 [Acidobacteriota bacterium]
MLVTVRLFARLREIAGAPEVQVEVPLGATVGDAWAALSARHSALAAYATSISCAVNEDYARMTERLQEGDEVAFLPPVSGG